MNKLLTTLILTTTALLTTAYADDDFQPKVVIKKPFPPITEFPILSAKQAEGKINDAELVLGIELDGQARAYPINMLTGPRREILNDTLADIPIAATW